jgi:tetratricopeptide (TPR) repeat protein
MEAVISGQAGLALLLDGNVMSSIHVDAPDQLVPRQAREFHYLFASASDLVFVENITPEDVRDRLVNAACGHDILQLFLILIAPDRPADIRVEAADELGQLSAQYPGATEYTERLLLSTPLPADADPAGARSICAEGAVRDFIDRIQGLQRSVRKTAEAWRSISEATFAKTGDGKREAADAVFVREGVWRAFVLAAAQEGTFASSTLRAMMAPAVKSIPGYRTILRLWRANIEADLDVRPRRATRKSLPKTERRDAEEDIRSRPKKRRRSMDRAKELDRVDRVKAAIVKAMKRRQLDRARDYIDSLVTEQVSRGETKRASKSLCSLAKEAQDLGLLGFQLELTSSAVAVSPDDGWAWSQHGKALLNNGRTSEALKVYEEAISYGAGAAGKTGRAETLRSMGRLAEALAAYDLTVEEHPENVVAKTGRAETLRSMGRFAGALAAYDSTIAENPDDAVAKSGRAETLRSMGRFAEALAAHDSTIVQHPGDVFAKTGRAETFRSMGLFADALAAYDSTIVEHPDDAVVRNGRAETLRSMGRLAEALAAYDSAIVEHPDDVIAKNGRAETLRSMGRLAEALAAYDSTIVEHPGDVFAKNGRAQTLRSMGRFADALAAHDSTIVQHPGDVFAKTGRAETFRSMGLFAEALAAYDSTIVEHPWNVVAKNGRAETLRSMGLLAESLKAYETVLRDAPENSFARGGLAWVLVQLGRFDEAFGLLGSTRDNTFQGWVAQHMKGMALLKQNKLADAITLFQEGVQECPWHAQRRYFASALAVAEMRCGEAEAAKQSLEAFDVEEDAPPLTLIRLHIFGMLQDGVGAKQMQDRLPETLAPDQEELRVELRLRYIECLPANRSDDWVFDREIECLRQAV